MSAVFSISADSKHRLGDVFHFGSWSHLSLAADVKSRKKNTINVTTIHQFRDRKAFTRGLRDLQLGFSQLPKIVPHYTPQGPYGSAAAASRKWHQVKGLWLYCGGFHLTPDDNVDDHYSPQEMWRNLIELVNFIFPGLRSLGFFRGLFFFLFFYLISFGDAFVILKIFNVNPLIKIKIQY